MDDLHLYIAIGLPTIAVLASLVVSLVQISGLRELRTEFRLLTGKVYEMMGAKS